MVIIPVYPLGGGGGHVEHTNLPLRLATVSQWKPPHSVRTVLFVSPHLCVLTRLYGMFSTLSQFYLFSYCKQTKLDKLGTAKFMLSLNKSPIFFVVLMLDKVVIRKQLWVNNTSQKYNKIKKSSVKNITINTSIAATILKVFTSSNHLPIRNLRVIFNC